VADSVDWRDVKYKEIFEEEVRGLVKRRACDPSCTIEDIEGMLGHLYIMDGADWGGRGCVQDVNMAAIIAAYEYFVAEWRKELSI
jgi:phage host-nuclease inhibitor protein Gam